jgi:high affinity Mn2+ porin
MIKKKIQKTKRNTTFFLLALTLLKVNGQQSDTAKSEKFSFHSQTTVITQYKPAFHSKYSGENSLLSSEETQTSITSTIYAGAKLWKGASAFINPEISGGSGLSSVLGVADALNGETFRVGSTEPKVYLARLFFRQIFPLKSSTFFQSSDINKLSERLPTDYLSLTIGKICIADYFDNNSFSHDPRTQFLSWGLMSNGAWDYPANTRGYAPSIVVEYVSKSSELRYGISLMPLEANGNKMNWAVKKASSHTLEYTMNYTLGGKIGSIRLLTFFTTANMGNYNNSIDLNPSLPDIVSTRKYGNTKYGFCVNIEQYLNKDIGVFVRGSWNDGKNETWAFTEIDRSVSAGLSSNGKKWNRSGDNIGLAYVVSGISKPHHDYLKAGGNGFMLGDGNINYSVEQLAEFYYSFELLKNNIYLSGTYQFLINPGYNRDRGPVNIFSVRVHTII